ncbi:furin-1-like isoform X1 [Antedon mediterranea]|uniref:furin-1-like isoform X1 n=1 Tax=Antedon mediterranea TaxID=105859 RepID=UPI003AF6E109
MDYLFLELLLLLEICICGSEFYLNEYAVLIHGGDEVANTVAERHGFINQGEIIESHFKFIDSRPRERRSPQRSNDHHVTKLTQDPQVKWIEQQQVLIRKKRDHSTEPAFNDPKWPKLWYLHRNGLDMNVVQAWNKGYTGSGVVVTILDDGIERVHPDLQSNYDPVASKDVNDGDLDPTPRYNPSNENRHGTRCAGEVAAIANNGLCSVGAAYNAAIGGVRMLDGDVTDLVEAKSLSHAPQHVDIYSSSWGPDDDGKTVDGPGPLAKKAFEDGIKKGRNGLGSIFVWASGNGGRFQDSCNCDGYTNTVHTLSISSVSESGQVPWYSERCASTLATTYSSGSGAEREVITTDLNKKCTEQHSGTSASAPLAAAICALALEANSKLTWRDLQHIIVMTSQAEGLIENDWTTNGAGYQVSHAYGFGLMNAGAMVTMAEQWNIVPEQHVCTDAVLTNSRTIPSTGSLLIHYNTTACANADNSIIYLEHVQARISLNFNHRGDLVIFLTSPMGTKSNILTKRNKDYSNKGFNNWDFMTTHNWGEDPRGIWTLEVKNVGDKANSGKLTQFLLVFYGTTSHPLEDHIGPRECANGYYLLVKPTVNGTLRNSCIPCHHSCQSCFGIESTDCIECNAYYNKRDTYCVYVFLSINTHQVMQIIIGSVFVIIMLIAFVWYGSCIKDFICKKKVVNVDVQMQSSKLLDDEWESGMDIHDVVYEDHTSSEVQDEELRGELPPDNVLSEDHHTSATQTSKLIED